MDEHFLIHLKKLLLETRQKLVSMNKIILLKRPLDQSVIYKLNVNFSGYINSIILVKSIKIPSVNKGQKFFSFILDSF